MDLATKIYPSTALESNIRSVVPPLSQLLEAKSHDRWLFELEDENDDVSYYDLYVSPCRGVTRASNDNIMDQEDVDAINDDEGREFAISYTNGGGPNKESDLYKTFQYYFDDLEYCGATFFGGCLYYDLEELQDAIESTPMTESFVNFTVVYDYEMHYAQHKEGISNDEDDIVIGRRFPAIKAFEPKPADPIPALEQVETIVLEHLGEVVGLSRRGCDPSGRVSIGKERRSDSNQHDFSQDDLNRMMAISSRPSDFLDPDHSECIVPVDASIGTTSECTPVTGAIRIYLNTTGMNETESSLEDLELSLQSGFQRLIRFGMQQDLYVTDEDDEDEQEVLVKHVSFIGTRIVVDDNELDEDIQGRKTVRAGWMVASIGLIVALFALVTLLMKKKK